MLYTYQRRYVLVLLPDLLRRGLKLSHLRLVVAISETGQVGAAADRLGITQPAASRLLAELERITGQPVHMRTGRGIALTDQGIALARRGKRVLLEISDAGRDIHETGAGLHGHVRIGAVTGPALDHVLPAFRAAQLSMPEATFSVEVSPSDTLAMRVLDGQLDFSISRVPDGQDAAAFDFTRLESEKVCLLVRRDHPLTRVPDLTAQALMGYDWLLPEVGAILRRTVDTRLAELGLPKPRVRLATSSFLLILSLVRQTDSIAPVALAVGRQFGSDPTASIVSLPLQLGIEVEPFGLLLRADALLPPAAARIRDLILEGHLHAAG